MSAYPAALWHGIASSKNSSAGNASASRSNRRFDTDDVMHAAIERGERLLARDMAVLILGETGTGKERLARALHAHSARRDGPLVTLNCAAIPETLIESELFGYVRGAFSGALPGGMKGKLASANGGTLFLDEIGDMPAAQQARLLRALSEREITPLGATQPVPLDFQVICATHQNLPEQVDAGTFRADLYYRVAEGIVRLPALRERSYDDRAALIERIAREESLPDLSPIAGDAMHALMSCAWPGNVRQLRAALRYACAMKSGTQLRAADLPDDVTKHATPGMHATHGRRAACNASLATEATATEATATAHASDAAPRANSRRDRLLRTLAHTRWNMSAAAKDLGICRSTLYRQLKALDIAHIRDGSEVWTGKAPLDSGAQSSDTRAGPDCRAATPDGAHRSACA